MIDENVFLYGWHWSVSGLRCEGKHYLFRHTFSLNSNLCFSRKLLNLNNYVSASKIFSMKECGSSILQFNLLQAHQASAKTQHKCNLTLNNMHDLTENQILSFYGGRRNQRLAN